MTPLSRQTFEYAAVCISLLNGIALMKITGMVNDKVLGQIRHWADSMLGGRAEPVVAAVFDLRGALSLMTPDFYATRMLPGPETARVPVAVVAPATEVPNWALYGERMARHGILRAVFTEPELAISWVTEHSQALQQHRRPADPRHAEFG